MLTTFKYEIDGNRDEHIADTITRPEITLGDTEFEEKVNGAIQEEAKEKFEELLTAQHNYEKTI